MVPLLTYPENEHFLKTAHDVYHKYGKLPQAMTLAIRLNDIDLIKADLNSTKDKSLKRQMAFQIARQKIWLDIEDDEDPELIECLYNTKLSEHFRYLGRELNLLEPRSIQDIYKTHLESSRTAALTNLDSWRHNLASAFVNGFVNAAFCNDNMMLVSEDKSKDSWVWKVKDDGTISTAASVGLLQLWDVDVGLNNTSTDISRFQINRSSRPGLFLVLAF